ncbi:MAG: hypothetical protein V1839_02430 [archaeon]
MNKPPYIGVTGFTTLEDVWVMADALEGSFGMLGVLMSHHTLKNGKKRGRWAALADVKTLMEKMPQNALRTIHWCDYGCEKSDSWKGIEDAIKSSGGECNAIQLNMAYPPIKYFKDLKEQYDLKTIFQIEEQMFEKPGDMARKIAPYAPYVDYVLIDKSMGAGQPIDPVISRAVAHALYPLGMGIVLTGGLCAKEIVKHRVLFREFKASSDAEGKLINKYTGSLDHKEQRAYVIESRDIVVKND